MAKKRRRREKPVSTGSIAFRIGLSSGFSLLIIFIVLDVVLFCISILPSLIDETGNIQPVFNNYNDFYIFIREWNIDILLRVEGIIVLL